MKEEIKLINCCSGCGYKFKSTSPDKYYQFCSEECREMVESEAEEIVDNRQLVRLLDDATWLQRLINHYII